MNVVRFAPGVTLVPSSAGVVLLSVFQAATQHFHEDWLVTSGSDSHTTGAHPTGEAFDVSVFAWNPTQVVERYHWLVTMLGPLFYVQYEVPESSVVLALQAIQVVSAKATGPHLHCQRARGTVYPPTTVSA